ncbi:hypothetical protein OAS59_00075 [Pelagibacteraceae bacterium]|jgi:hypothetical protein|nr:hypothetical protein [Pelagibacteraceae bacterium]
MKSYKLILIILVVFFKTGNVLSNTNIFDVNNIEIKKKIKDSNEILANLAIKKGFEELINKILLKEDIIKLKDLNDTTIKELVAYYQVENNINDENGLEKINFNISFDKVKMHNLFYKKGISYSKITNKEIFILPILKKDNKIYIYNKNYFYENWNEVYDTELIEFILPLENIEVIQNANLKKNDLLDLDLRNIFIEYQEKNIILVIIEEKNLQEEKIYFKTKIQGKNIIKNINIKRLNLNEEGFYKKIITQVKKEIINLVKTQNLIDVRTPSFLKAHFNSSKKNNLVELNKRLKKIDSIENIYIQKFNNNSVLLKIKYLGKLDKVINQMNAQKIILNSSNDKWSIKIN